MLLTSAESVEIENVTLALTSGANVNVHHGYIKVSTLFFVSVYIFELVYSLTKVISHRHLRVLAHLEI